MSYLIRQATIDDLLAICHVENTCFPPAEAATEEAFRSRIATFPERFLVAEAQGRIIGIINGCCTTEPVLGDELYEKDCPHSLSHPWQTVFGLAVLPEYQHQGIAKALMAHLVRLCQSGDQVGIILTCKQEKIGFYESMGFALRGVSDSSHGGARWFDMVLSL
jgi:ribosomal protein S18 acetylase RimI-like enzyme